MDAHFELWLWQSGRNCDRIGTSEPPLWLAAEALSQSLKGGGGNERRHPLTTSLLWWVLALLNVWSETQ